MTPTVIALGSTTGLGQLLFVLYFTCWYLHNTHFMSEGDTEALGAELGRGYLFVFPDKRLPFSV